MIRCKWCNLKNEKYVEYHDNEWCKPNFNDKYLFEMLILESFQAGLSWECGICSEIMEEELNPYDDEVLNSDINLLKPEEIHAVLDD